MCKNSIKDADLESYIRILHATYPCENVSADCLVDDLFNDLNSNEKKVFLGEVNSFKRSLCSMNSKVVFTGLRKFLSKVQTAYLYSNMLLIFVKVPERFRHCNQPNEVQVSRAIATQDSGDPQSRLPSEAKKLDPTFFNHVYS